MNSNQNEKSAFFSSSRRVLEWIIKIVCAWGESDKILCSRDSIYREMTRLPLNGIPYKL